MTHIFVTPGCTKMFCIHFFNPKIKWNVDMKNSKQHNMNAFRTSNVLWCFNLPNTDRTTYKYKFNFSPHKHFFHQSWLLYCPLVILEWKLNYSGITRSISWLQTSWLHHDGLAIQNVHLSVFLDEGFQLGAPTWYCKIIHDIYTCIWE